MVINSLISAKNYMNFYSVYKNLDYYRFQQIGNLRIANNNSKDEFVVISDWNFRFNPDTNLQFDVWALVDLHKLFWLIKFNNKLKNLIIYKLV